MKDAFKEKVKKILLDVDHQRMNVDDALQAIEKIADEHTVEAICGVGDVLSKHMEGR
jgi:predicted esterase YcpF (UPF0227 family)